MKPLPEQITARREHLGMSLQSLAQASNLRLQYLLDIESGHVSHLHILTLQRIADTLRCDIEDLTDSPKPPTPSEKPLPYPAKLLLALSTATLMSLTLATMCYLFLVILSYLGRE